MAEGETTIRKARIGDVDRIHALVSVHANRHLMLPRSRSELYESLRDYFVAEAADGTVVACGGLEISWADLAEIKSLAVDEAHQGCGFGRQIAEACLQEARELGIRRVFVLTYQVAFFEKLGFEQIPKEELPHKIWKTCINCPKFPDCDEVALAIGL